MKLKTVSSSCSLAISVRDCNYSYSSSPHTHCSYSIVAAKSKKHQHHTQGSEPTPPRITSNVKQNLRFLKIWKEFQKRNSSTPRPSTSYRRKKVEKEDVVEDNSDLYRDPTTSLYYTNQQGIDIAVPVLLVDGYNVCGYWMKLKKHFMKGRLDIARQKLIDELITFSVLREVKVVAVFDAMMSGLPTHKENFAGIDIIFSGETSADTWIEKEVRYSYRSREFLFAIFLWTSILVLWTVSFFCSRL